MDISIFSKVAQLYHHYIITRIPITRPVGISLIITSLIIYVYVTIKIIDQVSEQEFKTH